jgi:hypothetical protein
MRKLITLLMLGAMFAIVGCSSDDETAPPANDQTEGNRIATETFNVLGAKLEEVADLGPDQLRDYKFTTIRNGFEEALSKDSDNAIAHLGLSLIELLELNYSQDVWNVVDAFDTWLHGTSYQAERAASRQRTLIGRQFSLLVEAPVAMNTRVMAAFPPELEVNNIQRIIETVILPKLRRAMNHLDVVENHGDMSLKIQVRGGDVPEYIVIDLGEVYVFDASLRALAAGFGMAIAYDMDLYGPDGTYNWVDDMRGFSGDDDWCARSYTVTEATPYDALDLYYSWGWGTAQEDSLMMRVFHHNFAERSGFLGLRKGGGVLETARIDLLGTVGKLEDAVDFIRNIREDETEENVIKLTDLTDIDASLGGPETPNFAKSFAKIEDVLDFARSLVTDVVQFSEELGPDNTLFSWKMDLGHLFTDPAANVKSLLPYHRWNLPEGNWISVSQHMNWQYDNYGWSYWFWAWNGEYCADVYLPQIGMVTEWVTQYSMSWGPDEPLVLLDGPNGNPINLEVERFPYFADYTMNGLFPDMASRQRWLDLMDAFGAAAPSSAVSIR